MFLGKFNILLLLAVVTAINSAIVKEPILSSIRGGGLELFKCSDINFPYSLDGNLKTFAGDWYVFATILSSKEPACTEIKVPEAPVNGNYNIQLMYKDNNWNSFNETLSFPWNEATQNGILMLDSYNHSVVTIADDNRFMTVCSQLGDSTPQIRFLSRERIVSEEIKQELIKLLPLSENAINFIYQEEKCN